MFSLKFSKLMSQAAGARISIACDAVLKDLSVGASIAVNGACLTAVEIGADRWAADVSPETLKRTSLAISNREHW